MTELHYRCVGETLYCIETGLYRHGLAACYLVREGDRAAFVDTGTAHTLPALLALLAALGLTPEQVDYVIPTHVHLDHAGGAGDLLAACPNARLVVHPNGAPHLIDPARLIAGATAVYGEEGFARDFGHILPVPEKRTVLAEDGLEIDLNGRRLVFVDTPGHANHHGCLFDERTQGFFTGDTFGISYREFDHERGPWLFAPTTPVGFDPDPWQRSLDRLMRFDPQCLYLTHYGRLDHPAEVVEDLRQSIRDLAELALAEEGRLPDGRQERIRENVASHLVARARAHGGSLDEARTRELLAVDIELNAQGLEIWLRRRARQAARAAG